jgi:hypothetical protein
MKAFWLLVALLAVGASVYLLLGHQETRGAPPESTLVSSTTTPIDAATTLPSQPSPAASGALRTGQAPTPPPAAMASAPPAPTAATPELLSAQPAAEQPAAAAPATQDSPSPVADAPQPSEASRPVDLSKSTEAVKPPQAVPSPPSPPPAADAVAAPEVPKMTAASAPAAGPKTDATPPAASVSYSGDPKIVTRDDGSVLIDDRFVLRGKGTKEEPYKVTWDQLLSAQDDYVPREGRKKMPARITMLDGKYVELTGFVAFPVMADSDDECLSMMNQWDGCCIGVPPTPYDAVEVRLDSPAKGNARLTTYGTIKGKLKISPHLVGGWLVGLYVMDGGALKPQAFGGFAP